VDDVCWREFIPDAGHPLNVGGNLFPIPGIHRMLEGIYSRYRASIECGREFIPDVGHPLNVGGNLFPIVATVPEFPW
jgi:hypothetical protein